MVQMASTTQTHVAGPTHLKLTARPSALADGSRGVLSLGNGTANVACRGSDDRLTLIDGEATHNWQREFAAWVHTHVAAGGAAGVTGRTSNP